jgi:hypothetical protein
MSVAEALKVFWQGRGPRQPIGQLLEARELGRQDLVWAAASGYDEQFKRAARTLLANWPTLVTQPQRMYGPEVIRGSYYLEDTEFETLAMLWMVIGATFVVGLNFVLSLIGQFLSPTSNIVSNVLSVVFVAGALATMFWYVRRRFRLYKNFRIGRVGEDEVVEKLRTALDSRWTIFRNLHLPDRKDDLDIVLVGPGGIWVVEVKAFGGTLRVRNQLWERQTKRGWTKLDTNPVGQVKGNAQQLYDFLQRKGITINWVDPAIALAKPQRVSDIISPELPVWLIATLPQQVANLTTRKPLTAAEIQQIVAVLKSEAEKQIAREEKK